MTGRGKAGRFYTLTPKANELIGALKFWAAERDIDEEDISRLLRAVGLEEGREGEHVLDVIESLVKKGYLNEKELKTSGEHTT